MADLSRRRFLQISLGTVAAAAVIPACKSGGGAKELSCTDTAGLEPGDIATRTGLGYVDKSTEAGKNCAGCIQFVPAAPDACGGCKAVKGPINPAGYCKAFAPKPA